jgi:hypothetical protein
VVVDGKLKSWSARNPTFRRSRARPACLFYGLLRSPDFGSQFKAASVDNNDVSVPPG